MPIHYSTREHRGEITIDSDGDFSSNEMNEYVFLTEDQFFFKLRQGDFMEFAENYGNWYALEKIMPEQNLVIIATPNGRDQIMQHYVSRGVKVETYFLDIDAKTQKERLTLRGDTQKSILRRANDFKWIIPTTKCKILDGTMPVEKLADIIEGKK